MCTAVQYKLNPELLAERLKGRREGSKLWDEILIRVSNLMTLISIPATVGLDVRRFHWSNAHIYFIVVDFILFSVSTILFNWAMIANPHFEPTVRIQEERGHKAITSGPHKIVRYPGYSAGILYAFSISLIIGSVYTFIPVGIYVFLMIIRHCSKMKRFEKT